MGRFITYEKIVKNILTDNEETRANDRRLYLEVLRTIGLNTSISVEEFFLNDNDYPNLETIRRVRAKTQEKYPELRPPKEIQEGRRAQQHEYESYVHNNERFD